MASPTSDGFLLVDKPAGISSHDVVAMVRRARGGVRGGHTGTLDPLATGLLLVALGTATRVIRFVPSEPKVYRATIALGTETDTDDATGLVTVDAALPDELAIRAAIPRLTGELEQVPPAYSAKQVGGRRAYTIARAGGELRLAPARVTVQAWDLESVSPSAVIATISCSSGTYIRALARDLGRLCGSAAHLADLRRVRIGPFDVTQAVLPDESGAASLVSPADALRAMARQVVIGDDLDRLRHGRALAAIEGGETAALVDASGELLAVAERDGEWWQPRVVLHGA